MTFRPKALLTTERRKVMQNNVTFNLDDVNAMSAHAIRLRDKARLLVDEGKHAHAADCVEIAACIDIIRQMVMRMSHLLSK